MNQKHGKHLVGSALPSWTSKSPDEWIEFLRLFDATALTPERCTDLQAHLRKAVWADAVGYDNPEKRAAVESVMPIRTKMWKPSEYEWRDGSIDQGIVFAVKVLHAAGIDTCQSCQGGEGHAYDNPTVDLIAQGADSDGFAAVAALAHYGIEVSQLSLVWPMKNHLPYEKLWRVELTQPLPERADHWPMFERCYRAFTEPDEQP